MGPVIGIGTDLVEVARFREVLARTPGIVTRVFTEDERAQFASLFARFARGLRSQRP